MPVDYESIYGKDSIVFTKTNPTWGKLSNFYGNVEHKFQAEKYPDDPEHQKAILNADTPAKAKRMGGKRGGKPLTEEQIKEWNQKRVDVMKKLVAGKCSDGNEYATLLLSTGLNQIVEKAPWDSFWGAGRNGKGQNILGKILMQRRQELIWKM